MVLVKCQRAAIGRDKRVRTNVVAMFISPSSGTAAQSDCRVARPSRSPRIWRLASVYSEGRCDASHSFRRRMTRAGRSSSGNKRFAEYLNRFNTAHRTMKKCNGLSCNSRVKTNFRKKNSEESEEWDFWLVVVNSQFVTQLKRHRLFRIRLREASITISGNLAV